MWLPTAFCILLVCITAMQAEEQERPKRDLQFLKDVLAAKLGLTPPKPVLKEERIKIVQVPAFDQVLVRDAPKVTLVEAPIPPRIVTVDPTMALIGSYLGTKSAEETMFAMQNMKQLVQSGLISARQEVIEVVPPKPPVYVMRPPIVEKKVNCPETRPVYPIFERTVVPMPQPLPVLPPVPVLPPPPAPMPMPVLPPLPVLPPPPPPAPMPMPVLPPLPVLPPPAKLIPVPPPKVIVPEIRPVPLPVPLPPPVVPLIPTRYSYKQGFADGSVTTYFSEGNQDVIVTETHGPPPPLPAFIVARLENIVYGRPTGSIVPVDQVLVEPVYQEPVLPIITGPSNVDVKFNSEKPQNVNDGNFSYKRVHADGTMSKFAAATTSTNKPLENMYFEDISKLPPPPPQILQRFPAVSGGVYKPKPWGYSLKTSNGVSTYETLDGDKIFYSRLEPQPQSDASVLPAVLSSPTDDRLRNPNRNVIALEADKDESSVDEFGRPLISVAANGDKDTTSRPDIEPMKKFPALPTPIAGENHSAARYSYKLVHNPNSAEGTTFSTKTPSVLEPTKTNDYHGFGTSGFSYTQVNHDGTVDTFTGTKMESKPAVEAMKVIPALPAPIVSELSKDKPPAVIINFGDEQNSESSYTQMNKESSVPTMSGNGNVDMPAAEPVLVSEEVPAQPAAIVDVIQPIEKPCKSHKKCKKPHKSSSVHSGFSYTQISNKGTVTKFTEDGQVQIPVVEVIEVPAPAPAIVDVLQPIPGPVLIEVGNEHADEAIPSGFSYTQVDKEGGLTKYTGDGQVQIPVAEVVEVPAPPAAFIDVMQPIPGPVHVKVGKKHESEAIPKPQWSNYVYKQISHTNPQPFTVVKVGDAPDIEVPAGEVKVKVNKHWHERPDGTKYPCYEMHKVVPDAPIPPIPTSQMVSTVPEGLMYMPPENESGDSSLPNPHKIEIHSDGSHFSYTQVSSGGPSGAPALEASKDEPTPFHLNPIVVGPVVDNTYSYTQKHSDGSSLSVQGEKDSTVTVTVHEGKLKTSDTGRGDIPDATS